jgi:hypothetical protein
VDNAGAFVDAALSLAVDPGELSRLRAEAAASVGHLDWERIHDRFIETLRQRICVHRRRWRPQLAPIAGID